MLFKKELVVLGCGGVGSEVARIGRGFEMHVIGLSRSFSYPERFDEKYYALDQLEPVLKVADVLVSALPLNRFTENLLDYGKLTETKKELIMVNVGRAEVLDQDGIFKILRERSSTRFGTDVFWRKDGKEIFESKLWELGNFIGSKHTAGVNANKAVRDEAMRFATENVRSYIETGDARNEIRRDDYL